MVGTRDGALGRADEHFSSGAFQDDLARRVAIPTESQEDHSGAALHAYVADELEPRLRALGYSVAIEENPDPRGGPFLVAHRQESESAPTLLTYGHGDVVRGLAEDWREGLDPFRLTVEGDRWYGRGTADNKGQHSVIIAALKAVLDERGAHGFNSRLLIEMSEEIGSPGLDDFVAKNPQRLAADVFIASDGPRMTPQKPALKLGNRGSESFDLTVQLRSGSQHSGHWGGILEDPAVILSHALATIVSPRGQILIPEWRPRNIPQKVTEALRSETVDAANPELMIKDDWGEPGFSTAEKMLAGTSFIVLAMICGRPENPVNGVQPFARARCQLRFTVDADHQNFLPALRRHLDEKGFSAVSIEPTSRAEFPPWRTAPENPWVDWALNSMAQTLGERPTLVPNSSGGLPSRTFGHHLGVPVLWVPHSYTGCLQHGPDEHALAPLLREGLAAMTGLFWDLGEPR
ncbi:MAG: M20/M25/M40 family metallo-hydrolase [Pseudomonadota bacterium]